MPGRADTVEELLCCDQKRRERMPPPRPHNPELCGLEYALSCPECQAEYFRDPAVQRDGPRAIELAIERWHQLRLTHPSVLGAVEDGEHFHPKELPPELFESFLWTLRLPKYRPLFRDLFLDLFGDDIVAIVLGILGKPS